MKHIRPLPLLLVLLLAACAEQPQYPVTEHGRPFSTMNAAQVGTAPPVAAGVTGARLANARAEPQNWLTYYGAYDAQRYSALDQINTGNVGSLKPAWVFQTGVIGLIATPAIYGFEAAPIVVDGVMFVSGSDGHVWALDARSGKLLWQYRQAIPLDVALCCGNVNRGVAVAAGKVFVETANAHLVALDATDGRIAWERAFADVRAGESATAAPLVVKDMVIVGSSGGEYGVRGHIDAFDLQSGQPRWRHYTVPKPGEPGSQSWQQPGTWERGGGSTWITGSYDPALNLLYWSTGNPSPDFDGGVRPGDNLYTDSVLALDPDTGEQRWYYQFTPHDVWDYDAISENILFDLDGQPVLAHFDKNGYLFILDRRNGRLVRVTPFGTPTWGDIDPRSGEVSVRLTPTPQGTEICPGPAGAKEWPHAAYSPQTHLLYTPTIDSCGTYKTFPTPFREGMAYWGGDAPVKPTQVRGGEIKAIDPATGRTVWRWQGEHPMVSSLLATAGGLVFAGEPSGEFGAWDAGTGKLLWQFQTGSGIHSNPITYRVGNTQYVAVATGWGGWINGYAPELYGGNRGGALFVFALPAAATGNGNNAR
jgi:alcohol dehydrogenase (cytochrome c)